MAKINRRVRPDKSPFYSNLIGRVTFTIGAETGGNTRNIAIQLQDSNANDLAVKGAVRCYLAGDASGNTLATLPTGGVSIGTDGLMLKSGGMGITTLTDSTGGTANNTLEDLGSLALTDTQIDDSPDATAVNAAVNAIFAKVENNFADLAAKVNEILGGGREFVLVSEDDGDIDINITDSGTWTGYLAVILPDGSVTVSDVISIT